MQIFFSLITSAVLAPFLFTPTLVTSLATPDPIPPKPYTWNLNNDNKRSTPDCATPPTEFENLPYEFWIEVVFLKPIDDDNYFRPGNPLRTERYIMPASGETYDGAVIAEEFPGNGLFEARELFVLFNKNLVNRDGEGAQLWPDSVNVNSFPGYNPVAFQVEGDFSELPYPLDFRAVKVCTSNNETELKLRARRRDSDDKGVFVFGLPLPLCN